MIAEGIAEFNRGSFWEAHERWERAWRFAHDPRAHAHLKGMIQAAGAFVLLSKGRPNPAARLARRSLQHLKLGEGTEPRIVVEELEPLLAEIAADPSGALLAVHLEKAHELRARFEKAHALA